MSISSLLLVFSAIPVTAFLITTILYMWHKSNIKCFEKRNRIRKAKPFKTGEDTEVIIVGAGIVGSALATTLARDGRKVTIIERSMNPPKTFEGEAMLPGGIEALKELDLDGCLEEVDGCIHTGFWLEDYANQCAIPLSFKTKFPSFHHSNLVVSLRRTAEAEKHCRLIEGAVLRLVKENGIIKGVEYRDQGEDDVKTLKAALVILTDGRYSRFRKVNPGEKPHTIGHVYGFEYKGELSKTGMIDMLIAHDDIAYIYAISPQTTRILFNVDGSIPKNPKKHLKSLLCQYPEHLQNALMEVIEEGSVWRTPSYKMPPGNAFQPGVLALGDAFSMRHPVTAIGMAVGLKDIILWRDLLRHIDDLSDYESLHAAMKIFIVRRKMTHSVTADVFANMIYHVVAAKTESGKALRYGLLHYLNCGGRRKSGLADVLALIQTSPIILYCHLLAIVLHAMYVCIKSERPRKFVVGVYRAAGVLWYALSYLGPLTLTELKTMFLYRRK